MTDVDLGGTIKAPPQQKSKVIYMNIPTTIMLMIDIMNCPNCQKYIDALSKSIMSSLTKKELRKEIFNMFGVRTVKKMQRIRKREMVLISSIFGEDIWRG